MATDAPTDRRRNRRRATLEQIEQIQQCEGSCRAVAKALSIGKTTVWRYRQAVFDAWMAEDDTAEDEAAIGFKQLETPRRCSKHGMTRVWPCVQCAAAGEVDYE